MKRVQDSFAIPLILALFSLLQMSTSYYHMHVQSIPAFVLGIPADSPTSHRHSGLCFEDRYLLSLRRCESGRPHGKMPCGASHVLMCFAEVLEPATVQATHLNSLLPQVPAFPAPVCTHFPIAQPLEHFHSPLLNLCPPLSFLGNISAISS